MDNQCNVELRLLNDYLDTAQSEDDLQKFTKALAIYSNQVKLCKRMGCNFNVAWYESMIYYLQAMQKGMSEGFFEKAAKDTMNQAEGLEAIFPALLVRSRATSRIKESIRLLDKAIEIYPRDPDYWYMRAVSYYATGNTQAALADVDHLLSHFGSDEKVYLKARKLKDEIEAKPAGDCFIATAIYQDFDSPQLAILRNYRDNVLLNSTLGSLFVSVYYRISPMIAMRLRKSNIMRKVVRLIVLDPIVTILKN